MAKLLTTFFERGQSPEVLNLMARMLGFTGRSLPFQWQSRLQGCLAEIWVSAGVAEKSSQDCPGARCLFTIVIGHHKQRASPLDPASARLDWLCANDPQLTALSGPIASRQSHQLCLDHLLTLPHMSNGPLHCACLRQAARSMMLLSHLCCNHHPAWQLSAWHL